jgi:hypothetical protein
MKRYAKQDQEESIRLKRLTSCQADITQFGDTRHQDVIRGILDQVTDSSWYGTCWTNTVSSQHWIYTLSVTGAIVKL